MFIHVHTPGGLDNVAKHPANSTRFTWAPEVQQGTFDFVLAQAQTERTLQQGLQKDSVNRVAVKELKLS